MSDELKPLIGAAADRPLTRDEAEEAFRYLFEGQATPSQIGGLLMALRTRGETVEEYAAAAAVMRSKCHAVKAPQGAMDIVGTGGDGKGTLNISTATAFVVAGAGAYRATKVGREAYAARLAEEALYELDAPVLRVCSEEVPIPYAKHLEDEALPQVSDIVIAVRQSLEGRG